MFIIIFHVYDLKIHFIYAIPLIFRFLFHIVTSSHPFEASLYFLSAQWCSFNATIVDCYFLVVFLGFLIAQEFDNSFGLLTRSVLIFGQIILLRNNPPSLRSLLLDSVATTPSMATDPAEKPHLYPLFLPLVAHP